MREVGLSHIVRASVPVRRAWMAGQSAPVGAGGKAVAGTVGSAERSTTRAIITSATVALGAVIVGILNYRAFHDDDVQRRKAFFFVEITIVFEVFMFSVMRGYLYPTLVTHVPWSDSARRALLIFSVTYATACLTAYPTLRGFSHLTSRSDEPTLFSLATFTAYGAFLVLFALTAMTDIAERLVALVAGAAAILSHPGRSLVSDLPNKHGVAPGVSPGAAPMPVQEGHTSLRRRGGNGGGIGSDSGSSTASNAAEPDASSSGMPHVAPPTVWELAMSVTRWRRERPVWLATLMLTTTALIALASLIVAQMPPVIVRIEVPLLRLPPQLDGYTIVQLSDIHVGPTVGISQLQRVVDLANSLSPNLVALTGDFLDGDESVHGAALAPLASLRTQPWHFNAAARQLQGASGSSTHATRTIGSDAPAANAPQELAASGNDAAAASASSNTSPDGHAPGTREVFAVSGNHEFYDGFFPGKLAVLESLGVAFIDNTCVRIPRGSTAGEPVFDLVGVADWAASPLAGARYAANLSHAMAGVSGDNEVILLAHQPKHMVQSELMGVGLQLSGHTHGGQIFPLQVPVYLGNPYFAGSYMATTAGSASERVATALSHASPVAPHLSHLRETALAASWKQVGQAVAAGMWPTHIYVSRGSIYWGPPMRLFAPQEITVIVLRSAQGATGS